MSTLRKSLDLEESLKNKSSNAFTSAPEFAELVALIQKFHELLSLTPFTHYDLEMALQQENNQNQHLESIVEIYNGENEQKRERSQLIENLLAEILLFFSIRFDRANLCRKLYSMVGHINRWCVPPFDTRLMLPRKRVEEIEATSKTKMKATNGGLEEEEDEEEDKPVKMEENAEIAEQQNGVQSNEEMGLESQREQQSQSPEEDESSGRRSRSQASSTTATSFGRDRREKSNSMNGNNGRRRSFLQPTNVPDYLNMTAEEKLHFLCFLVDAQLACAEDSGNLDQDFPTDQQRHLPLAIDPAGRKFWYFPGDTWLFMEEGRLLDAEEEERNATKRMEKRMKEEEKRRAENEKKNKNKAKMGKKEDKNAKKANGKGGKAAKREEGSSKKQKNEIITQRQLDETYSALFTGHRLRVVCNCADHFAALIAAYKNLQQQQRNAKIDNGIGEFIEKLEQCAEKVTAIEEERLRKAAEQAKKSLSPSRQSSRIAKMLESRRLVEEQRQKRHAAIMAEQKRLQMVQVEYLWEHRRLTDSQIQTPTMSREDRLKMRQQRIQDQFERDQLIEAGLLTPTSPSMAEEEDGNGATNELAETEEEEEGDEEFGTKFSLKRKKTAGPATTTMKRGRQSLLKENEGQKLMAEEYEQKYERMMRDANWWQQDGRTGAFAPQSTSAAATSSDGSFISLFQPRNQLWKSPSPQKNRQFIFGNRTADEGGISFRGGGLASINFEMSFRKMPYRESAANHSYAGCSGGGRYRGVGCEWIRNALKLTPDGTRRLSFATHQPTMANQMAALPVPKMALGNSTKNTNGNGAGISNGNDVKFSKWAQVNPAVALGSASDTAISYKKHSMAEMIAANNNLESRPPATNSLIGSSMHPK